MDENVLLMAEAQVLSAIEDGIKRVRANLPKPPANFDGKCEDCGEEIPQARIDFGAVTCVPCQTIRERKASLMRRP